MAKRVLLQGNEACVEGAIAAGMRFFAGYPITPSTEIAEQSSLRLPQVGGHFIQMEDEISSMAAVIGASVAGVKSMTATSGPGFSLKQENIGYASMAEVPCVIVNVQRAGPSTGLPTSPSQADVMQARWGTHGDHPIIAISPSSVSETYTLIIKAFNLSEKYRVPVIFLMDEIVGHMREGIELPDAGELEIIDREWPDESAKTDPDWLPYKADPEGGVPSLPPFGYGYRYHITGLTHNSKGYPTSKPDESHIAVDRLMKKVTLHTDDIVMCEEFMCDDADTVILAYGGTARSARAAVKSARERGLRVGMFRPVSIWPFPENELRMLSEKTGKIIVAEHNYGQILYEAERIAAGKCAIDFIGKIDGTVITPEEILEKLEK